MKTFLIKVNGNQYEVEVEEISNSSSGIAVNIPAPKKEVASKQISVPKAAEPSKTEVRKADTSVPAGAQTVNAPMPGTILKINIKTGDEVTKGQVLCVLEAMKMENEIVAPASGKVVSVNVNEGAAVNAGDVLVSLN